MMTVYTLKTLKDTKFKQSAAQSDDLDADDVIDVLKDNEFPVAAVVADGLHLKVTLGKESNGKQFTLNGKNTWWVFGEHVKLTKLSFSKESPKQQPTESIIWTDPNCRISKFFTVREVTNGDWRRIPYNKGVIDNILTLSKRLDEIRIAWGSPIGVTSWYRPPDINRAVGGVSNSQHINGGAADLYAMNGRDDEFEKFLDRHWNMALGYGIASGRGFTHVDLRPGRIRWWY